jgi:hypothetical protein
MNEEYVVIGNEGGNNNQMDSINQGIKTSSLASSIPRVMMEAQVVINNKERNEDQMDFKNQGIRTSPRPKRFPNTRSDDFLWILRTLYILIILLKHHSMIIITVMFQQIRTPKLGNIILTHLA